jgi:hypothetical protein
MLIVMLCDFAFAMEQKWALLHFRIFWLAVNGWPAEALVEGAMA